MKNKLSDQKLRSVLVQFVPVKNGVVLKRGCTEVKFTGRGTIDIIHAVFRKTQIGATREEILDQFAAPQRTVIDKLLDDLIARRFLVGATDLPQSSCAELESTDSIFYWHFGELASEVLDRLNQTKFVLVGVNRISRHLVTVLTESGVKNVTVLDDPLLRNLRLCDVEGCISENEWKKQAPFPEDYENWPGQSSAYCIIAASDFGWTPALNEWNEFAIKRNVHFLPVVLSNFIGYVGPLVVPGETACYQCLQARQNAHMDDSESRRCLEQSAFEGQAIVGFHPSMTSSIADIAAIEITKFYSGISHLRKLSTIIEVSLLAPRLVARKVLKIPRCPVCSSLRFRSSVTPKKHLFD